MKGRIVTISVFLLLFASERSSFAETLSMEDTLLLAYRQNPKMKEARESIEAQIGRKITDSAFKGPEVSFEIGGFKSQEVSGEKVTPDKSLDSFEVIQPFDPPGVRFLKGSIAEDNVRIAKGNLATIWASVYKDIKTAYSNTLFRREAVRVFETSLNSARQFRDAVEGQYQSGKALKSESIRARVEVLKAESELFEAEKDFKTALIELNLLLDRSPEEEIILKDSLDYRFIQLKKDGLVAQALSRRADVLNQKIRLASARKDYLRSQLSFLPEPFVGFSRTREDYDNDTSILLGGKLPLWDFNLGEMKEKNAVKAQEEIRLRALENEVSAEVIRALSEAELSMKKVEIQKKAFEEVSELQKQASIQYQEGDLSFLGYLESLKTAKEIKLSYFESLKNHYKTMAEFERAIQSVPIPEGKATQ